MMVSSLCRQLQAAALSGWVVTESDSPLYEQLMFTASTALYRLQHVDSNLVDELATRTCTAAFEAAIVLPIRAMDDTIELIRHGTNNYAHALWANFTGDVRQRHVEEVIKREGHRRRLSAAHSELGTHISSWKVIPFNDTLSLIHLHFAGKRVYLLVCYHMFRFSLIVYAQRDKLRCRNGCCIKAAPLSRMKQRSDGLPRGS